MEPDPARRDMLVLRREIEHDDHMAQAWERVAGQTRAIGGPANAAQAATHTRQAQGFREDARQARKTWEERSIENPSLYPPLNEQMRVRTEAARQQLAANKSSPETPSHKQPEPSASESAKNTKSATEPPDSRQADDDASEYTDWTADEMAQPRESDASEITPDESEVDSARSKAQFSRDRNKMCEYCSPAGKGKACFSIKPGCYRFYPSDRWR